MKIIVKNEIEFQNALTQASTTPITCISIDNDIVVTTPMVLPKTLKSKSKMLVIEGNGSTIESSSALTSVINRKPLNQTEALNVMQSQGFVFRDLNIINKVDVTNPKQACIDLGATYNSIIDNCKFSGSVNGLHLKFCLMTKVSNCLSNGITGTPFIADMGDWTGASNSNSQSNHTSFTQCRVMSMLNAFSGFSIYAASGIIINHCIVEGAAPQHGIYFDDYSSSVVKDFEVVKTHIETKTTVAGVKIKIKDGYVNLKGIFSQYPMTLIDMQSNGAYPDLYVEDIPYLAGGTLFKTDNKCVWSMFDMPSTFDITATVNWVGGIKPYYYYCEKNNQSRSITTNALTVNGKLI